MKGINSESLLKKDERAEQERNEHGPAHDQAFDADEIIFF